MLLDKMVKREDGLVKIPLTKNKWVIIDESDYPLIRNRAWHLKDGKYAQTNVYTKGIRKHPKMHRVILGLKEGDGKIVDHINRDGLDNRRCNLRLCNPSQNSSNKIQKKNKLGLIGVTKNGTKNGSGYQSRIKFETQVILLGSYKTPEEAARARDKKAIELHGEFAVLNFPKPITQDQNGKP